MKKRYLSLILSFLLSFSCLSVPARAEEVSFYEEETALICETDPSSGVVGADASLDPQSPSIGSDTDLSDDQQSLSDATTTAAAPEDPDASQSPSDDLLSQEGSDDPSLLPSREGADLPSDPEGGEFYTDAWVNPYYEDVIPIEDIAAPTEEEITELLGEQAEKPLKRDGAAGNRLFSAKGSTQSYVFTADGEGDTPIVYTDYDAAGDFILSQFQARADAISLPIEITTGAELHDAFAAIEEDSELDDKGKQQAKWKLFYPYLWRTALSHDPEDPTAGDYAAYQYGGYGISLTSARISTGTVDTTIQGTITYKMISSSETSTNFPKGTSYYYSTAEQEAELTAALDALLPTLYTEEDDAYARIRAIYGYICSHVTYDHSSSGFLRYTPYAAMINGSAVCQGYSGLLYRMALSAGVDARIISGYGGGGNHAWNLVRLDDQLCYYGDTTWDRQRAESQYTYFLKGSTDFTGHTPNHRQEKVTINGYLTGARPNFYIEEAYPVAETAYSEWGDILPEDRLAPDGTAYASGAALLKAKSDVWVAALPNSDTLPSRYTYTGKALRFDDPSLGDTWPHIYDGKKRLSEGTDYTVSYKNNTKAGTATINIKYTGNYRGTDSLSWTIRPADLSPTEGDNPFLFPDATAPTISGNDLATLTFVETGSEQKPVPAIQYQGMTLKNGTDYTVTRQTTDGTAVTGFRTPGEYRILVTGKGNYTGTRILRVLLLSRTVQPEDPSSQEVSFVPLNKVRISGFQSRLSYSVSPDGEGNLCGPRQTGLVLTYNGQPLTEGTDYDVDTTWTTDDEGTPIPGTAVVRIRGRYTADKGGFVGTLSKSFQVTGLALSKAVPEGFSSTLVYTGNVLTQSFTDDGSDGVRLLYRGNVLEPDKDYTVRFTPADPVAVGKVTVTITGRGGYTGTKKLTYRITPQDLSTLGSALSVTIPDEIADDGSSPVARVYYQKGGSTPKPEVVWNTRDENGDSISRALTEGRDYTLRYRYNNATDGANTPFLQLAGKGNYRGLSAEIPFRIEKRSLDASAITATLPVAVYRKKRGAALIKPVLADTNGRKLAVNKDYTITAYRYRMNATVENSGGTIKRAIGDLVDQKDIIPAGTLLSVTLTAKDNSCYLNSLTLPYQVMQGNLAKARITVAPSALPYTGKQIRPGAAGSGAAVTVLMNGQPLTAGKDYTLSYGENLRIGTGTVTVTGTCVNWGGSKTVRFRITQRGNR